VLELLGPILLRFSTSGQTQSDEKSSKKESKWKRKRWRNAESNLRAVLSLNGNHRNKFELIKALENTLIELKSIGNGKR